MGDAARFSDQGARSYQEDVARENALSWPWEVMGLELEREDRLDEWSERWARALGRNSG